MEGGMNEEVDDAEDALDRDRLCGHTTAFGIQL